MASTVVLMELDRPGKIADEILRRLDGAFFAGEPHHLGQFEVVAEEMDVEEMRREIATIAAAVNPDWADYMHFVVP